MLIGVTDHFEAPFEIEARALPGAEFVTLSGGDEDSYDEELLARIDALLVFHAHLGAKTLASLPRCRIVVRYGVGVDNLDLLAFARFGVPVCNTPDYGVEEIALTTVAHILNLWRRISQYDIACREHRVGWVEHILRPIPRLSEATLGIVGVGRMGAAVVRYMSAFGCRVLGYDKHQPRGHEQTVGYTRVDSLGALLEQADIVSLHCVLTEDTRGMVDEAFLETMKPGALLVNTARGGLFKNLDVLEAALRSGRLGGLGTDVLPEEPPGDHPLIHAWREHAPWLGGRLMISPHTAYYSESALHDMRYQAAETIHLYLQQGILRNHIV